MKNNNQKIEKLVRYLNVTEGELLIVREDTESTEDFIIASVEHEKITKTKVVFKKGTKNRQTEFLSSLDKPFTLVQQRNRNGMFYIPDVEDWKKDEEVDY